MSVFKKIHIGNIIKHRVIECELAMQRICNFFKCTEEEIEQMYLKKSLNSEILLQWSKLLEYDLFRIYSQHLILYAPPKANEYKKTIKSESSVVPEFKKNIYTKEIINFMLELIETKEKSIPQIVEEYNIPRTTLYRWIKKYK